MARRSDFQAHAQPNPELFDSLGVQETEDTQVHILEIHVSDGVRLGKTQGRLGPDDRESVKGPLRAQTDFLEWAEAAPTVSQTGEE